MRKISRVPRLPTRDPADHKGRFGHVLIVGGAVGMSGSVALAGRAASRGGAGLVTIATTEHNQPIVAALVPEALTVPLPQRADGRINPLAASAVLEKSVGTWTVLAAGCGWGTADKNFAVQSLTTLRGLAKHIGGPTVLDADGLNLLSQTDSLRKNPWPGPLVLTPHPGEMARLLGCSTEAVQADRLKTACAAVTQLHASVVVLKGAGTIVTDGQRYYVNTTGNPGMATGGTGDVLTGLLAALLAQHLEPFDAAVLAVYLHGLAGDLAAKKVGQVSLIAPDLLDCLSPAILQSQR